MELRKADGAVIAVAVASYFVVSSHASPSDPADRHTRAQHPPSRARPRNALTASAPSTRPQKTQHHFYMAIGVVRARKQYKVEYPHMYATKEACPTLSDADRLSFAGTQRGMLNSLEMLPSFLALLAAAGVAYPWTAAGLGTSYLAGRVAYFRGYSTGSPAKRINAGTSLMYVGALGLAVTAGKAAVEALLRGK